MQLTSATVMHARNRVRRIGIPAILAVLALSGPLACHKGSTGASPMKVILEVTNRGFFDVNVFVIRSPVAQPIRLGMVTGSASQTFRVDETNLQSGQVMVLQVRTIAGQSAWTSPSLVVSTSSIARLDVVTTSSGDLSQSRFYTSMGSH